MRPFPTRLLFVVLVGIGSIASPASAQQKQAPARSALPALEIVPDDALGFGVVRNLTELDEKIAALAQELQIPAPGALMTLRQLAGVREGLDDKGAVVLAVVAGEESDEAIPVLYVPVTDYKKFIAQLRPEDPNAEVTTVTFHGKDSVVAKAGNYAALTKAGKADQLKKVIAGKRGSLRLASSLTSWIGKHDAYFVAMPEGIKRGIAPIRNGMQEAKRSFPADNEQLKNVAAIFDVYDQILATFEKEVTHFGVGLRIDEGTIFVNSQSVFVPGGSLAKAARDAKKPQQSGLEMLPSGPYLLAFEGVFAESWFQGFSKFSAQFMRIMGAQGGGKELSEEDLNRLTDAMQQSMRGVKSMAFRMGMLQPGKSMYDSMSGVIEVENSRAYLANYEKAVREMSKLFENASNPLFKSYQVAKADVDGVAVLELTMDMSGMLDAAGDPMQRKMMELMLGPAGKLTAYIAPADADTVAMAYSKEALRQTLDTVKNKSDSLANDDDVAKTMKLLPRDAQWVGFLSPKGMVNFGTTIVQNVVPGGVPQLPPFPDTAPIGFGARMTTQGCETSLVVPKDALAGIGGYIQMIQQNVGAGAQPPVPQKRRPQQ